ncbi:hypothetical protein F6455_17425 [Proteobacteria bacterium 005FR1]|nr:hypothetical protein [Proteobacteria bacterium 005FR1]
MKNNSVITASVVALGIISLPALASKGAANGQPFQYLQSQIDSNRALIQANAGAISDLIADVAAINTRIDEVSTDIDDLALQVAGNTAQIDQILGQISSTQSDLTALRGDVADLAARHATDFDAISQALDAVDAELVRLNNMRQALAVELNAALTALNDAIDDNAFAIDSLLAQLVAVNAQLTIINSSIADLNDRSDQLEEAQATYASQLAELTSIVGSLGNAVETLQSYHLFTFEGIQTNLPVDSLNGWSQCYSASYADLNAHAENMVAACTGSKIMLACRQTGSDTLTVAAYANRQDVFFDTGTGNGVHTANGVDWYYSPNYSMGFAPVGEGVTRYQADIQDQSDPERLSWHTLDQYTSGWRCGSAVWLNGNVSWEKVIYQAD